MVFSRCGAATPALGPLSPAAAPFWPGRTASVAAASLSSTEPATLRSTKSTRSLYEKELALEGEGWKDLQKMTQCLPPERGLCRGYSVWMSELPAASWRAASRAVGRSGASPTVPTLPVRPRWGGKCLCSRFSAFFLRSPLWCTLRSRILRSAPSSRDPSGTGGAREQSRTCASRERKQDSAAFPVPSPPGRPSAQRRLLFQHGVTGPGASGKFL